jgi:hypothetical protein
MTCIRIPEIVVGERHRREMEASGHAPAQLRALIRATNHVDPRCSICPGHFVGDVDAVIEFARVGDVELPGFHPDDLICAHCWYGLWDERGGIA